jgi:hypothetical protein
MGTSSVPREWNGWYWRDFTRRARLDQACSIAILDREVNNNKAQNGQNCTQSAPVATLLEIGAAIFGEVGLF